MRVRRGRRVQWRRRGRGRLLRRELPQPDFTPGPIHTCRPGLLPMPGWAAPALLLPQHPTRVQESGGEQRPRALHQIGRNVACLIWPPPVHHQGPPRYSGMQLGAGGAHPHSHDGWVCA
eukprot:scaffold29245_cov84-Isochrysis_galbana.AAC.2